MERKVSVILDDGNWAGRVDFCSKADPHPTLSTTPSQSVGKRLYGQKEATAEMSQTIDSHLAEVVMW